MSVEPGNQEGWTFATMKAYFEAKLEDAKAAIGIAVDSVKEDNKKTGEAINERFKTTNRFREQFDDRADTFAPKDSTDFRLKALETLTSNWAGRWAGIAAFLALACTVLGAVYLVLRGL